MSLQVPMWSCGWWWPETLSSKVTQVAQPSLLEILSSPSGRASGPFQEPFYHGHLAGFSELFFQTCFIYKDKTGLLRGGRDNFSL